MTGRDDVLSVLRVRLDEVIRRSGASRSGFAADIGVDRSTLSQLLSTTNRRLPRLETLLAIADDQQVSMDWLVGLTNAGAMQAEMLQEATSFAPGGLAENDERLLSWFREAVGYKVRHVPATLPDLVKTEAVISYELADNVAATPSQRIQTAAARLAWTRGPETEMECCSSVQSLVAFARGEGVWSGLAVDQRRAQIDHMIELTQELYPTLRWFLFDARQRYAAPVTIFGPLRAALYVGQMYLVLTSTEHVRTLSKHFDDLIRGAVVQPNDIAGYLKRLRTEVRR